jgi:CRISPR-associated protein Cmr2
MTFDFITSLTTVTDPRKTIDRSPSTLASGFADDCAKWAHQNREEARKRYRREVCKRDFLLPDDLRPYLDPDLPHPIHEGWLALRFTFELLRPWYARDDRVFHVLDNPLRKDHVFGVPYIPAATWKGLLRWACRMRSGLRQHLESGKGSSEWHDAPWIVHLFGNEQEEETGFERGALVLYPTWFSKIGFEVINPHDRKKKAGRHPILYEVVPAGTDGQLTMLYAPLPGSADDGSPSTVDAVRRLLEATESLLTKYGFSAKRTAGWGIARITGASVRTRGDAQDRTYNGVAALSKGLEVMLSGRR